MEQKGFSLTDPFREVLNRMEPVKAESIHHDEFRIPVLRLLSAEKSLKCG
jgi:hypothetical protein